MGEGSAYHISDKGLISKIFTAFRKLTLPQIPNNAQTFVQHRLKPKQLYRRWEEELIEEDRELTGT